MPNGQRISNEEMEQAFQANGWNFHKLRESHWMLPFHGTNDVVGYQVHVENGLSNEGFIGVHIMLLQAERNHDCLHKAFSLMNGRLGIVKFNMHGDQVVARTALPRLSEAFSQEKLREALSHAIGGVLTGARFARPILECCVRNDGCDVEEAFRDRLAETGHREGEVGVGLAPPPEG